MFKFRLYQIMKIAVPTAIMLLLLIVLFIILFRKDDEQEPVAVSETEQELTGQTPTASAPTSIIQRQDSGKGVNSPNIQIKEDTANDHVKQGVDVLPEGEFFKGEEYLMDQYGGQVYLNPDWNYDKTTGKSTITFNGG